MKIDIKRMFSKLPQTNRRLILLVAAGVLAILLIAASEFSDNREKPTSTPSCSQLDSSYERELEKRLEEIISQIDSVGKVSVMVKTVSGEENRYAVNDTVNYSSDGDKKSESEYVLIKEQNAQSGMLVKKEYPEIQGVMIVCEGGDSGKVKNEVTNAVCALLGLNANSVSVSKMNAGKEY